MLGLIWNNYLLNLFHLNFPGISKHSDPIKTVSLI